MAADYIHSPGTLGGHCIGECNHKYCIEDRHKAQQKCKHCGELIGYERDFYYVFTTSSPEDGWYEHADCGYRVMFGDSR